MQWKRCSKCKNLKPLDRFWNKNSEEKHSRCIDCMKKEQDRRKEKKKEYDKKRYEHNKNNKKEIEEIVCMRCDTYRANVRNNAMYWCFHCLLKYEEEWKQKIPVEVINISIRRVKNVRERTQ